MSKQLRAAFERAQADHQGEAEGWFHTGLATFFGAVAIVLSVAPWNLFPLAFIGLIPVLAVTRVVSDGVAFRRAWLFGIFVNLGGFPWVMDLVVRFGEMPPIVGFVMLILLALQQGLIPAIAFWLARKVERGLGWRFGYALPLTYVAAEFAMPLLFPWRLGHSQVFHLTFLQLAELGGVHLMTFVLVLCNVGLFDWIRRVRSKEISLGQLPGITWAALGIFLFTQFYGLARIRSVEAAQESLPTLRVGLVEADIEIEDKWNPKLYEQNLYLHQSLSAQAVEQGAELVVWPESAYELAEFYYTRSPDGTFEQSYVLDRRAYRLPPSDEPLAPNARSDARRKMLPHARYAPQRGFRTPLITGTTLYRETTPEERATLPPTGRGLTRMHLVFNSSILLDEDGVVQGIADKVARMPISEFIPGAQWVYSLTGFNLYQWVPSSGLFGSGDGPTVLQHTQRREDAEALDVRIGMLNCYEDLMPGFVRKMGAQEPDFLLNQTNDAWFGRAIEPPQHMALALPRAVEARTWLVRSTNTGVSTFIDASGRVRARTSTRDAETLVMDVPLKTSAVTPYRVAGEWVAVMSWALVAFGLVQNRRQRRWRVEATSKA